MLDIRKGDMVTEKEIHILIPPELYHYGEWCVWDKEIARIWLHYYNVELEGSLEDYLIERNKKAHKAIVKGYSDTLYLNFLRYFRKESNLDLSEPDKTEWRAP